MTWKAEIVDKCPKRQDICPLHDDAFLCSPPPNTHTLANTDTQGQQFQRGQHLFGDKVTLLPGGLWKSTIEASHPAHIQPAVLGRQWARGAMWEASQHPSTAVLKPYSGSPLRWSLSHRPHRRSKIPACNPESRSQQMERLLSEGTRQRRRLPIHPHWKQ